MYIFAGYQKIVCEFTDKGTHLARYRERTEKFGPPRRRHVPCTEELKTSISVGMFLLTPTEVKIMFTLLNTLLLAKAGTTPVGNITGNLSEPYRQTFYDVSGFVGTRVISTGQRFNIQINEQSGFSENVLGKVNMLTATSANLTFYTDLIDSDNLMRAVSLHEWLHVLGYGTTNAWYELTPNAHFVGQYFVETHGKVAAVEGGHWHPNETGRLNHDIMKPTVTSESELSPETLSAIKDLHPGWDINTCRHTYECPDMMSCYDTTNFDTGYCSGKALSESNNTGIRAAILTTLILVGIIFTPTGN